MNITLAINPIKRMAYAFVGLLGGNAILLVFLLEGAIRNRADLIAWHMGEPEQQIPQAFQLFRLYARFSFIGWLFVGLPIALFFPTRLITRLSLPLKLLVGASLGPVALFAIFVLIGHGRINFAGDFIGTEGLWRLSILVSSVSFTLYAVLLSRQKVPSA